MQEQIISLITPGMALIFTCVFAALWWRERTRTYVAAFAFGYGAFVLGFLLFALLGRPDNLWPIIPAHFISAAGGAAMAWGAALRLGVRSPFWAYGAIMLVSTPLVGWAALSANAEVLVIAQNGASGLIFAIGATVLWTHKTQDWLDNAVLWTFSLVAALGLTRPLIAMLAEGTLAHLVDSTSAFRAVNVLLLALLTSVLAILIILAVMRDNLDTYQREARIDPLSGLPNRGAFEAMVGELLGRASDEGTHVTLVVGDIDHFKRVNDDHGHLVGDRVIARFGEVIAGKIRTTDVAGRIGGEEFCILVWDCAAEPAARLADRIRIAAGKQGADADAANAARARDPLPGFTASFGVAQWRAGESYPDLFRRADAALYEAKRNGRNRVEVAGAVCDASSDAEAPPNPAGRENVGDDGHANVVNFASIKTRVEG